jgi:hypothetical protein
MTTSAPDSRYWQLRSTHPLSGDPIGYTWPAPLPREAAASIIQAIISTYTVTDLTWHLDDGSNLIASLILFTHCGIQRLTCLAAADPDDAVVRLEALAKAGTLVPLA